MSLTTRQQRRTAAGALAAAALSTAVNNRALLREAAVAGGKRAVQAIKDAMQGQRRPKQKNKGNKSAKGPSQAISNSVSIGQRSTVSRQPDKVTRIHRKEFVTTLLGSSSSDTVLRFRLDPASPITYPWLSQIVSSWEQYKIRRLVFTYVPNYSSLSTTGGLGQVIMGYDPNAEHIQEVVTKVSIMNLASSAEAKIDKGLRLSCSGGQVLKKYFVGSIAADSQFSEIGGFFTFVSQVPLSAPAGDLWVEYEIDLYRPKIAAIIGSNTRYVHFFAGSGASALAPFGLTASWTTGSTLRYGVDYSFSGPILRVNAPGRYLFFVYWSGSSAPITTPPTFSPNAYLVQVPFAAFAGNVFTSSQYGSILVPNTQAFAATCFDALREEVTHVPELLVGGLTGYAAGKADAYLIALPEGANVSDQEKMTATIARALGINYAPPEAICTQTVDSEGVFEVV